MSDFKTPMDILEFPRLSLYTPTPGMDKERSSFGVSLLNKNPRFTVWTRIDDKENGPIAAGIGPEALEGFVDMCMDIVNNPDMIDAIAFDTCKPDPDSTQFAKVVSSTLTFGRGEDGLCFIGLRSADSTRPVLVFQFRAFEWHPFRRKSKPYTESEMSTIHAKAWLTNMSKSVLSAPAGQTPEQRKALAEQRKARRNGGGGGYDKPTPKPATYAPTGGFDGGSDSYSF